MFVFGFVKKKIFFFSLNFKNFFFFFTSKPLKVHFSSILKLLKRFHFCEGSFLYLGLDYSCHTVAQ